MKYFKSLLLTFILLLITTSASAQDLSLRGSGALAIPLTEPQSSHFQPGLALAIQPQLTLAHYFVVGPKISYMVLPSAKNGSDTGTSFGLGGFAKIQRPHDELNDGSYLGASPWIGPNIDFIRTGDLNRFGGGLSAGVNFPLEQERKYWLGYFASYQIINEENGHINYNTNSSKTFLVGLDFTIEPAYKQAVSKNDGEVVYYVPKAEDKPVKKDEVQKSVEPKEQTFTAIIQFPFDSAKLEKNQQEILTDILSAAQKDMATSIKIEGHASSEGRRDYNLVLSQHRADSVKNWLISKGIKENRITAVGKGVGFPVSDNNTNAGRILNRRSEFTMKFTFTK